MPARFVTILVLVLTGTLGAVFRWRHQGAGWGALVGVVVGAALGLEVAFLPVMPRRVPEPNWGLVDFLAVTVFFIPYGVFLGVIAARRVGSRFERLRSIGWVAIKVYLCAVIVVVAAGLLDSVFRAGAVQLPHALEMFPFGVAVIALVSAFVVLPAVAVAVLSVERLTRRTT